MDTKPVTLVLSRLVLALTLMGVLAPALAQAEKGAAVQVPVATGVPGAAELQARQFMKDGLAHFNGDRFAEALRAFEGARDIRSADPALRRALGVTEYRISSTLYRQLKYREALQAAQAGLKLDEESDGPENLQMAIDLLQMGTIQSALGLHDEALTSLRRALAIRINRLGDSHEASADAMVRLSWQLQDMGRFGEALPLAQRALAVRQARFGASHSKVADTLNIIASIFNDLGKSAEALTLYERLLALREMQNGPGSSATSIALNNLAVVLGDLGRREESEKMYRRALAITESLVPADEPELAERLNNLAYALREMGRPEEALPLFQRSLSIREKIHGPAHLDVARSLRHIGATYLVMNQPGRAAVPLERAMRILAVQESARPVLTAQAQHSLAQYYQKVGLPHLAILYGKLSINTIQGMRRGLASLDEDAQRGFLDRNSETYQRVAGWLIDAGRLGEAQQILSILKEEEYHDYIRRDASSDARDTKAALTDNEKKLADQFRKLGADLFQLAEQQRLLKKKLENGETLSATEELALRSLDDKLAAADQAFHSAMDDLRKGFEAAKDDAGRQRETRLLDESLKGVVSELGDGVMLLHTITMPDHLRLLVTHAEARKAYRVEIKASEVNRKIQTLLGALKDPRSDPRPAAGALYEVLIKPVEADLAQAGTKHLMVSLDGALRYVPMAVLWDGKQYLAERYALSLYIEASRDRMKDAPRPDWSVAGLGVSQAHKVGEVSFVALDAVPRELASIVRTASNPEGALQGTALLDQQFSADSLRSALSRGPAVVHIASHFKFTPGTEQDSFLLLGDGKPLSLFELRTGRYDLKRVDLLTLSACETAVDGSGQGNEVEGLAVTAQRKGAKAVMASLWPVEDGSTSQLMRRFYQLREQKMSKAEALRRAQLELLQGKVAAEPETRAVQARRSASIELPATAYPVFVRQADKPYAHPYFWAPFVLMGNWL